MYHMPITSKHLFTSWNETCYEVAVSPAQNLGNCRNVFFFVVFEKDLFSLICKGFFLKMCLFTFTKYCVKNMKQRISNTTLSTECSISWTTKNVFIFGRGWGGGHRPWLHIFDSLRTFRLPSRLVNRFVIDFVLSIKNEKSQNDWWNETRWVNNLGDRI